MRLLVRLLILAVLLAGLLSSGRSPGGGASGPGGAEAAAPQPDETTRPKATRDDDIERFEPSEEVPAASAVSFPVDI